MLWTEIFTISHDQAVYKTIERLINMLRNIQGKLPHDQSIIESCGCRCSWFNTLTRKIPMKQKQNLFAPKKYKNWFSSKPNEIAKGKDILCGGTCSDKIFMMKSIHPSTHCFNSDILIPNRCDIANKLKNQVFFFRWLFFGQNKQETLNFMFNVIMLLSRFHRIAHCKYSMQKWLSKIKKKHTHKKNGFN